MFHSYNLFTGGQSFFQDNWGCIPMVNRAPWCPVTLPAAANYHDNPAMGLIGRQVGLAIWSEARTGCLFFFWCVCICPKPWDLPWFYSETWGGCPNCGVELGSQFWGTQFIGEYTYIYIYTYIYTYIYIYIYIYTYIYIYIYTYGTYVYTYNYI